MSGISQKAITEAEALVNEAERKLRKAQYERDMLQKQIDDLTEQCQVAAYILNCLKTADQ